MNKLKISSNGPGSLGKSIYLNDVKLEGVLSAKIDIKIGESPKLTMELLVDEILETNDDKQNIIIDKEEVSRTDLLDLEQ